MPRRRVAQELTVEEHLNNIRPPNVSIGICRTRTCVGSDMWLANGYCTECWDRGLGSRTADWGWSRAEGREAAEKVL